MTSICTAAEDRAKRALEEVDEDEAEDDEKIVDDNDQSLVTQSSKTQTLSEYELTKQKNIAENKLILSQIKADFGHVQLREASKHNEQGGDGKKKRKGKEREVTAESLVSRTTDPSKRCVYIIYMNKRIVITNN